MQQIIPFPVAACPRRGINIYHVLRASGSVAVKALLSMFHILQAAVTPPPEQEYIEQYRVKAIRFAGHF
jgi:hypothetical protein